jgi:hypothetical protein
LFPQIGYDGSGWTKDIHLYQPDEDTWIETKWTTPVPISHFGAVYHAPHLYLIGMFTHVYNYIIVSFGRLQIGGYNGRQGIKSCYRLDITTSKVGNSNLIWEPLPDLPYDWYGHALVIA